MDWCPGTVVFRLELDRLISYKQHWLILQIWDILHNDFFLLSEVSSLDLNRSEAPYHSGRGFTGVISDNEALYSDRGAHRFMAWSDLVAMVVRWYYGFEVVQGRSEEDRWERIERCYGC